MVTIDGQRATLSGALDIYQARPTLDALRDTPEGVPLEVDLSAVEALDASGLQVLAWLRRRGPGTRFVNPSPPVRELFDFLGLRDW
jgi:anti-anti-sigma regulatory factor